MKFTEIAVIFTEIMVCTMAAGYGSSGGSYGGGSSYGGGGSSSVGIPTYGGGGGGSGGSGGSSSGRGQGDAPKPYSFDYNAADGQGNNHYRNEQGDQNGNVKGTYGYTDAQGLYRVVEYVADEKGFRANIRTNEPGVDGKESPADVVITAEQPPAGVQPDGGSSGYSKPSGSAARGFSAISSAAGKPPGGAGKPPGGTGKSGY